MSPKAPSQQRGKLTSLAFIDAYTDFILSRQAMNCTPATVDFYQYAAGAFLSWLERKGITQPNDIAARHIRSYLAELVDAGRTDWTVHGSARAARTLLRFWHAYVQTTARYDRRPEDAKKNAAKLLHVPYNKRTV